jgi:hypothetical protein
MKKCHLFSKHDWRTVAIDTSNGWTLTNHEKVKTTALHTVIFSKCAKCHARKIIANDVELNDKVYVATKNRAIELQRTIWEEANRVTGYVQSQIVWVDTSYAPLGSVDQYINAIKDDENFKELIKSHSMVDDAMGQLEVAIKICNNNPLANP